MTDINGDGALSPELRFSRVPADIVARDVVPQAPWHLVQTAHAGLPARADRTFQHTPLVQRSGVGASTFWAALRELLRQALTFSTPTGHRFTPPDMSADRQSVDGERHLEIAAEHAA